MLIIVTRSGQAIGFMEALSEADRLIVNDYIKFYGLSERPKARTVNQVGRFMVEIVSKSDDGSASIHVQSVRYANGKNVTCANSGRRRVNRMHSDEQPLIPSKEGEPELSQEMADEIRRNAKANPPKPTIRDILGVPRLFVRRWLHNRRMKRQADRPAPLDEYGLPLAWHHDDDYRMARAEKTRDEWVRFERWCKENDEKPIRASVQAVLGYLSRLPKPERKDAYEAISHKHESIYWHTGGCPHCELHVGFNLYITDEGELTFPLENPHLRQ